MERGEKAGVSSSSNGGDEVCAVKEMMDVIDTVGSYVGYRRTQRKECLNLKSLLGAKKLLKKCGCGSKIYLAMESEAVMSSFHAVYDNLNQALDDLQYDELGISDEVNEQVELTRMQLKRAKRRADTQDIELAMDMMRGAQNSESIQQIKDLLGKFRQIAGVDETIVLDGPVSSKSLQRCQSLIIPHEFLCPITMEIMVDPVIVSSGQTYERESIQKWLNSKHRTCPKTGQILDHLSLATNFALRNLILQWCEKNNYELPKKDACLRSDGFSAEFIEEISSLVRKSVLP
ncbi:RING-TYPE E3 UBIQUITIN TRANSFERASE [Salix koriyanagi]|uniref:RING-type E3 ubiquitin transferase n=1 Tax=Salix koriyanagi TaxID=2511006 RepID=A0A9Q0V1I1_9ROSI|nr:RING-TYPE E3 UBIQUITIN TRANSFERASE [Salix koriyanagi]